MSDDYSQLTVLPYTGDIAPLYELLLLADPAPARIEGYIVDSWTYCMLSGDTRIGVAVLLPVKPDIVEIVNLAIHPDHQGRGFGRWLLRQMCIEAERKAAVEIRIATANSSTHQLRLYQQEGFEITGMVKDHFIHQYPEPLFEDGIQAKHQLLLSKQLQKVH